MNILNATRGLRDVRAAQCIGRERGEEENKENRKIKKEKINKKKERLEVNNNK